MRSASCQHPYHVRKTRLPPVRRSNSGALDEPHLRPKLLRPTFFRVKRHSLDPHSPSLREHGLDNCGPVSTPSRVHGKFDAAQVANLSPRQANKAEGFGREVLIQRGGRTVHRDASHRFTSVRADNLDACAVRPLVMRKRSGDRVPANGRGGGT